MNEGKATRYHRLRRRAQVLGAAVVVLAVVSLLGSGASVTLRETASALVEGRGAAAVGWSQAGVAAVYTALVWLLLEALLLPVHLFRGHVLERRYALSRVDGWQWCRMHLATIGLGTMLAISSAVVVSTALRLWPSTWWLVCAAIFSAVSVGLTAVAPLTVIPWFSRISAVADDTTSECLATLAARAGIPPLPTYQCAVGDLSRRAQATLVGLGPTRRVLVSDTLVADYSKSEIDAVLAHELGHHVHRDVWQLAFFEFAVVLLALRCADWAMVQFGPALGLTGPSDVAALPLLALGAAAVAAVSAPLGYALSRYQERRADQFAIRLTDDPASLVSGLRRLGAQNLAEEAPSRLVELLWHTHPPLGRRLAAARDAANSLQSSAVRTASDGG
jgi:STE24 endopeptidase